MIIVTGAKGQLGSDVCRILKEKNVTHLGIDIDDLDITSKEETERFFADKEFDCLIHCAAYTAVDKAEEDKELCFKVNSVGTENLAIECEKKNAKIIYISTDYVFSGEGSEAFETDSEKAPLSTYGKSKSDGEDAVLRHCRKHFIVRTSWVFGEENRNFIFTMLRLAKTRDEISVVDDQTGSPTYSPDLAMLLTEMAQSEKYGIYHATNEGYCTWYELAKKTFEIKGIDIKLKPIITEEYPTPAKRPHNSRLSKECLTKAGFKRLPGWEDAVERYLSNI